MSGVFGVSSKKDCAEILFYGTDYHTHLGTEFGGMAIWGDKLTRQIHNISQSQFKAKFYPDIQNIRGNKGIGVISALEEQPIYLNSKFGPFCLVFNGSIENADEIAKSLMAKGFSFSEVSRGTVNSAELIAKLITQGKDIIDGIENVFKQIEGSCSLLILNKDGIYAACDRMGYNPLVVGKNHDSWAVTSETTAFYNNDFT
ncbi:MAG TPA: amidophosphoribosyltransferase, partial [Candidatus Omnitrophota bacterium]|nr:amidophosphoribosyltransferase [Candidatus Omnitrophota bacterium]